MDIDTDTAGWIIAAEARNPGKRYEPGERITYADAWPGLAHYAYRPVLRGVVDYRPGESRSGIPWRYVTEHTRALADEIAATAEV
jgi:hypothetical protein